MKPAIFNPRCRSLLRGSLLVLASFVVALLLSHFPQTRPNPLIVLPALAAVAGTIDHARCMRTNWSWYHGGVVLCIYTDLMVLGMIFFLLVFPYATWLSGTH